MVAVESDAMVPASAPPPQERGDMSFELRAEISAGVAKLTANNISKVVDIIRQTMPSLGHDEKEIELDVNALDTTTLWRLYDFIKQCQATRKPGRPKKASSAANWRANMDKAARQTGQNLQNVRAARGALGGADGASGSVSGLGNGAEDDWIDDGDSDDALDVGGVVVVGGGGSGVWESFQSARQQQERDVATRIQRERQRQDAMHQEQVVARHSAAERQQAAQRERESQRAAERARRERERACGADMLGQSNMMSSFEQEAEEDDQSIFDEYGMGGF